MDKLVGTFIEPLDFLFLLDGPESEGEAGRESILTEGTRGGGCGGPAGATDGANAKGTLFGSSCISDLE